MRARKAALSLACTLALVAASQQALGQSSFSDSSSNAFGGEGTSLGSGDSRLSEGGWNSSGEGSRLDAASGMADSGSSLERDASSITGGSAISGSGSAITGGSAISGGDSAITGGSAISGDGGALQQTANPSWMESGDEGMAADSVYSQKMIEKSARGEDNWREAESAFDGSVTISNDAAEGSSWGGSSTSNGFGSGSSF